MTDRNALAKRLDDAADWLPSNGTPCQNCQGTGQHTSHREQSWQFETTRCNHCKGTGAAPAHSVAGPERVTDEMVKAARKAAPKFWRDYDSSEDQMRKVLAAALARSVAETDPVLTEYEPCYHCAGTGLQANYMGEPTECHHCKGNTVLPATTKDAGR